MPLYFPGGQPGNGRLAATLLLAVALILSACSPTFNWRELRPQGTPLQALMPCKPEHASRTVPLAGAEAEMHLHSCETGGMSFAVAWVDLGDPVRVDAAMREWPRASLATLRLDPELATAPQMAWGFSLPGAPRALGVVAHGTGMDGEAVQMRAAYFARGAQVFQAAVFGARLPAEVTSTFFEALHLP